VPASREQFIVDDNGRKTKVVLPIKDYEKLLEDLHDVAVVAERKCEEPVPLEDTGLDDDAGARVLPTYSYLLGSRGDRPRPFRCRGRALKDLLVVR